MSSTQKWQRYKKIVFVQPRSHTAHSNRHTHFNSESVPSGKVWCSLQPQSHKRGHNDGAVGDNTRTVQQRRSTLQRITRATMQNSDLNLMFEDLIEPHVKIQYIFIGYTSIVDVFISLKVQRFSIVRHVPLHFAFFFFQKSKRAGILFIWVQDVHVGTVA